jgi:hypothetical protein
LEFELVEAGAEETLAFSEAAFFGEDGSEPQLGRNTMIDIPISNIREQRQISFWWLFIFSPFPALV